MSSMSPDQANPSHDIEKKTDAIEEEGASEIIRISNSAVFRRIAEFYDNDENFGVLHELLKLKKHGISLRAIEYATVHRDEFKLDVEHHGRYRDVLDSFGKRRMDIFKRHSKYTLTRGDKSVVTNSAQLRFIKFAITTKLIEWIFVPANLKRVEVAMAKRKATQKINTSENRKIRKKITLRAIACGATNIVL